MKRIVIFLLAILMVSSFVFAGGAPEASNEAPRKKVALVSSPGGTDAFITLMQNGVKDLAKERGFDALIIECSDMTSFEDNMRGAIKEGCDLIVGGGWEANEGITKLSQEYKGECDFILIDDISASDNVASVSFRESESMYLVGMFAALVTEPEDMLFGSINVNQGAGSWKWRYGFMEGIRAVKPEAEIIFNYTGSYNDPAKGKEYALQMNAQGCKYIAACCSACGDGIKEAALEKHFYTDDSDVDRTTPDNPYIVTSMIKDTYTTAKLVISEWLDNPDWKPGNRVLGVKEGALGAVHVNYESAAGVPMPSQISAEDKALLDAALAKFMSGEMIIDPKTMITEEQYYAARNSK